MRRALTATMVFAGAFLVLSSFTQQDSFDSTNSSAVPHGVKSGRHGSRLVATTHEDTTEIRHDARYDTRRAARLNELLLYQARFDSPVERPVHAMNDWTQQARDPDEPKVQPAPDTRRTSSADANRRGGRTIRSAPLEGGGPPVHPHLPLLQQILEEIDVISDDSPLKPAWIAIEFSRLSTAPAMGPSSGFRASLGTLEGVEDPVYGAFDMFCDLIDGRLMRSKENMLLFLAAMNESPAVGMD